MADYSVIISDGLTITERIDVLVGGTRRITVSDFATITEKVDTLRAGTRTISVSDTTPTSENIDVIRANARTISVSDIISIIEGTQLASVQSPAAIVRSLALTLVLPATLPFIVTKKDV